MVGSRRLCRQGAYVCGGDTQLEYRGWMEQSDRARAILEGQGAINFGGGSRVWSDGWAGPWRMTPEGRWEVGGGDKASRQAPPPGMVVSRGGGEALKPTHSCRAKEEAAR